MTEQDRQRPSSTGSIKRNNSKMAAEGLIVLPPEPGLVKFESVGISRPSSSADCLSAVRGGSAGRVERSLQVARKKELEDELPRQNGAGPDVSNGVTDNSVTSTLGKLKLSKQEEGRDAPAKHTVEPNAKEDSESSDTDSSDSEDKNPAPNASASVAAAGAPVELKGEFLRAVMDEEYEKAKELCQKILLLEPDNKTCSEFHAVIVEKMKQDDEDNDSDDDEDDDENSTEESDESGDEDESGESDDDNDDKSDGDDKEDEDDDGSDSDDDFTLPSGPINLIMGGLPIIPQSR